MQLEAFQHEVAQALRSEHDRLPTGLFVDGPLAQAAWRVYRNNVYFSLMSSLAEAYPVVNRLLGDEGFAKYAQGFVRAHPPESASLVECGQEFPDYLRTMLGTPLREYVPEAARLDGLFLSSQHSEEGPRLDIQALTRVPRDQLPDIHLSFHRSVRLFQSPLPIVSIWQANKRGIRERIRLDAGPEAALLVCVAGKVSVHPVSPASIAVMNLLRQGRTVAESCAGQPNELVTQTLSTLFHSGGVAAFNFAKDIQQ